MKTKHATRTVLLDQDEKVAIIHVGKHNYYKIPGGGIEKTDPNIQESAKREVLEESGCNCEILSELGKIETTIPGWQMHDISEGFLARVKGEKQSPHYDDWESQRDFSIEWHPSLQEAIKLIESNQVSDPDAAKLQARDLEFLKLAQKTINR